MSLDFFRSWSGYRQFKRISAARRNIVVYSEGGQDWHHLAPIVNHLTLQQGRTVCYVSSDPEDSGLSQENDRILPFYIRKGFFQITFFQTLSADVVVLTMLDLDCLHIKRSLNPVHYVYVFHAMGSTHMVDLPNSYDHYDSIFCVGPHQVNEIRKREEVAGLPPKHLFEHGYARLDKLIAESKQRGERPVNEPRRLLLAPTWGDESILNTCGKELVKILLDAGYHVTLRPHYRTRELTPEVIDAILAEFGDHERLDYIDRMGESESLFTSDLLICDWSSTSIEYSLALEKPVLYIDVPPRIRNPEYEAIGLEPMEMTIRNKVGEVLSLDELSSAPALIDKLLADPGRSRDRIVELRSELVFNAGNSAAVAATEIARLADENSGRGTAKGPAG